MARTKWDAARPIYGSLATNLWADAVTRGERDANVEGAEARIFGLAEACRKAGVSGLKSYRGKGNITQPSANATPRKVRKTVAPYCSRSFGDSFEVSEKTMETQNAKIVRAVKCDSSMRLFLSAYGNIKSIQND